MTNVRAGKLVRFRRMNVDAADLDPVQWGKPARPANDASDDAISEKQPADKPGQPAERSTH